MSMIEFASTADMVRLYSSICPRMAVSRSFGFGMPTGRSTNNADTWLFIEPFWSALRTETGTIDRTTSFSEDSSPRPCSRSRNPPVIAARTTSLTVPPNAVRTALNSSNLPSVQAQRRCGPIGPLSERAVGVIACLARDGTVCATVLPCSASDFAPRTAVLSVGSEEIARAGWASASVTASATRDALDGVRRGVEHQLHQLGDGDAVDHAVVDLGDDRPAVVGQALYQPQLPQGLGQVQTLAEHAAGQVAQLLLAARTRHRGVPHVVQDLEVRVVHPHGPAEAQRHLLHPLPVARHEWQLAQQQPHHVAVAGGRPFEQGDRPHVHRGVLALREEEARVEGAHPVHVLLLAALVALFGPGPSHVVGWPPKLCVPMGYCNMNCV